MSSLNNHINQIEKAFVKLPNNELLHAIQKFEREAQDCEQEDPTRAYRLYRVCTVGTRLLRRRIDSNH